MKEILWKITKLKELDSRNIPITLLDPYNDGIDECNEVIEWAEKIYTNKEFLRTTKGYLKKDIENLGNYYEISGSRSCVEILIHDIRQGWSRIQFRNYKTKDGEKQTVYGINSLQKMITRIPELKDEVIDNLEFNEEMQQKAKAFYNIEECDTAFQGIPVESRSSCGKNLQHVYSLDCHAAFPSSLAEIRPELREKLEQWYKEREENPIVKEEMVSAIGAMTAERTNRILGCKRGLSKLRYEILEHHALKLNYLANELLDRGCKILNFRTDSIKFICLHPERLEDMPFQGAGLGNWDFEFKDCQYRQFSTGKYEYYDNAGELHIVLNGKAKLELEKPRSEWEWDDLINCGEEPEIKFDWRNYKFYERVNYEKSK